MSFLRGVARMRSCSMMTLGTRDMAARPAGFGGSDGISALIVSHAGLWASCWANARGELCAGVIRARWHASQANGVAHAPGDATMRAV